MSGDARGSRVWKILAWTTAAALFVLAALFLMDRMKTPAPPAEPDRVAAARRRCESELRAVFEKAGVRWPAGEIFLRGMKREGQLELWARDREGESFRLMRTYRVMAQSGIPGPKRREGDMQVPEGFYEVNRFNPQSAFHLSLGLNYPNASDRILGDPAKPGFDIFIHGGTASIGCLAMGDPAIEEIFLAALDSKARPIHAHIFPAKMDAPDWTEWRDAQLRPQPGLRAFWDQLAAGWDRFERERRVPVIDVAADGTYRCRSGL